jgi:purine-nucleoside/S-methyl-5'-thioadenosine phosphorylase / adenosine deaminase
MDELPVPGPVPRFELGDWRTRYGVVAGITGRGRGTPFDLGLAGVSAPVGQVMDRWKLLRNSLPEFPGVLVSRQIHGTEIIWHSTGRGLAIFEGADGHATDAPGLLLAVTAADCIPVYLVDPVRRAIALLHAGWRGVAGRILPKGIDLLRRTGSRVENLLVHCGIGICGLCYEVKSEVFLACGISPPAGGQGGLDLRAVLSAQVLNMGVGKVSTSQFCSRHDSGLFLSHRGSGGADGRMVAYLGLLP